MKNRIILPIFNKLELNYRNICSELNSFMSDIIQWTNEVPETLKTTLDTNESTTFAIPKTPHEMKAGKKTRKVSRKPKMSKYSVLNSTAKQNDVLPMNESVSFIQWSSEVPETLKPSLAADEAASFAVPKSPTETKVGKKTRKASRKPKTSKLSVLSSTTCENETFSMNESISFRTRGATRAAFKMSQLNTTKDKLEVPFDYSTRATMLVEEKEVSEATDATFVVPKATTRTKPVFKNKKQSTTEVENPTEVENATPEVASDGSRIIEKQNGSMENISGSSPEVEKSRKLSKTLSGSPTEGRGSKKSSLIVNETLVVERPSRRKVSRSLSGCQGVERVSESSPTLRSSGVVIPRSPSQSPVVRSRSKGTPGRRSSGNNISTSILANCNPTTPEFNSLANRTVTIKKESTPIAAPAEECSEKTLSGGKTFRQMSTFVVEKVEEGSGETLEGSNVTVETEEAPVAKKKRKVKEDAKENIEGGETVRITRTKSKALKKMMEETEKETETDEKQQDLAAFAKKILSKAKMTSLKKNKLATIIETNSSTPANRPPQPTLLYGSLTSSKYHLLLSSSKKLKTPLATLPNSAVKCKSSQEKERMKKKMASRDSSAENVVRSATKPQKDDKIEKEMKLKSRKEKEEQAELKRQNVIKSKQEELRRKNELKHQMAMKQREKLEQEKYQNMLQTEKEKEERHKIILQERQMKIKEEAMKKKMITMQKMTETMERRRQEEEARIARLKEIEAEEQRLALEKQKEEKRALERLAEKKAQEEYEMQLKQELEAERLRAEKMGTAKKCMPSASKTQSASKRQKFAILGEKKEWDYKPRNENDYGLEHENSDSEEENNYDDSRPPIPWANRILNMKSPTVKVLTLEMLCEFLPCYRKSPDIHKMFKMTPSKRIKRSSSAIWNTPSS